MKKIKVLLADDHRDFRKTVAAFLERQGSVEIVGEAGDGNEAIRQADSTHPDLVLMDVHMPEMNGVEATREIKSRMPETKVVMLTFDGKESVRVLSSQNLADGFIEKSNLKQGLLNLLGLYASGTAFGLATQAA